MSWNFGDLLDGIGAALPSDAPALIHGDRSLGWGAFARRSNNLAAQLIARGAQPDDKVAFYLRNCPEYMETLAACFKARLVHVNVNFRYRDDELHYIFDNSDAKFAVFDAEFAERVAALRERLPALRHWIQVGSAPLPFAQPYDALVGQGDGAPLGIERSGDDRFFVYTGGTTGRPKAVMWRSEDLWGALGYGQFVAANGNQRPESPAVHIRNVGRFGPGDKQIPVCPLMHGAGLLVSIATISSGGCTVTMGARFDPIELWETVARHSVASLVIVGDAFARPMLRALDENPGRWDIRSLRAIISSGVMWSREVKMGLLRHHPGMVLLDAFGSTEAVGFGSSLTTAAGDSRTGEFKIGDGCKVFTPDHREVKPGSGERGFVARSGPIPLGYYKDPEKSARSFPTIDGVRYSMPGDWCTVEADGTLTLLGRGSACINSGGEKVYPEEVEECLKTHPAVEDALVIGVPDERWGQVVIGVVQLRGGAALDEERLREHVRAELAGYKVPKRVLMAEKVRRTPSGKADYVWAAAHARARLEHERGRV